MKINLLDYFNEGALSRFPNKLAVIDGERKFSFKELEHYSKNLSSLISDYLDSSGEPVAVFMPKSAEVIISNLAILYSGNFYTNFDFASPKDRLNTLIESISPKVIITNKEGLVQLNTLNVSVKFLIISVDDALTNKVLYKPDVISDTMAIKIDTDPACIISTSGSTGIPKSVVLSHRNIIDFIDWVTTAFTFSQSDVIGSLSPFHFDIYSLELFVSLSQGSVLHIIPPKESIFPSDLVNFLLNNNITFIFWVPTIMVNISNLNILDTVKISKLKKVFFAGEVFPAKHLNYWRTKLPGAQFVNLYGPIEIAVDCTYYIVNHFFEDDESVPIGKPCRNTDIIILDSNNKPVKEGEQGELCVRGSSLSLGYFNNLDQTNKVFVQNPLNKFYPEKIYRTGDLVYLNAQGEIMYVGRKDFQIKHMGYRVELLEIELAVLALQEVKNACILYNNSLKQIIMVFESDGDLSDTSIRQKLSSTLPKYMLPTKIKKVELIPRNANGKIDRQKLLLEFS
jgi:D-alanine--poly(phosphoribitol) ligase subunit 1